ncbi:MAG: hypothetical protein J6Y02_14755 [Pseudobutyrivibrio sp.]|nr:hypothetical protein [Pseudobutyrivibrio sp.]
MEAYTPSQEQYAQLVITDKGEIEVETVESSATCRRVDKKENWLTVGQIVYFKPGSLAWKMISVIDQDPETILLKKRTRPYVVISKSLANRMLNTVWLMPIKSISDRDFEDPNRVTFMDHKGRKSEIDTKTFFTAQVQDLDCRGTYIGKEIMERAVAKIVWNLPFQWKKVD